MSLEVTIRKANCKPMAIILHVQAKVRDSHQWTAYDQQGFAWQESQCSDWRQGLNESSLVTLITLKNNMPMVVYLSGSQQWAMS